MKRILFAVLLVLVFASCERDKTEEIEAGNMDFSGSYSVEFSPTDETEQGVGSCKVRFVKNGERYYVKYCVGRTFEGEDYRYIDGTDLAQDGRDGIKGYMFAVEGYTVQRLFYVEAKVVENVLSGRYKFVGEQGKASDGVVYFYRL